MPINRRLFLSIVTGSTGLLAGCGGGGGDGGGNVMTKAPAEPDVVVRIQPPSFQPYKFVLDSNATVEWVNESEETIELVSAQFHENAADWAFSHTFEPGERFRHTFEEDGLYEYYSKTHGKNTMCGALIVGDVSFSRLLPCEG